MSGDPVPDDVWNEAIRESYYLLAVASDVAPSLLAYTEAVELLISELRNCGWEFSPIAFDTRKTENKSRLLRTQSIFSVAEAMLGLRVDR